MTRDDYHHSKEEIILNNQEIKRSNKETKDSFADLDNAAQNAIEGIQDAFQALSREGADMGDILEDLKSKFLAISQSYTQSSINNGFNGFFSNFGFGDGFSKYFSDFGNDFFSSSAFGSTGGGGNYNMMGDFSGMIGGFLGNQSTSSATQPSATPFNVTIMAQDLNSFKGSEQYISSMIARSASRGQRNL